MLFSDTTKAVVIMEGNSLNKELCDIFNFNANDNFIDRSAFVQSRKKIKPKAFEEVFKMFNTKTSCDDLNLLEGYRLLAVDGSDVNISQNKISTTYFPPNNRSEKGSISFLTLKTKTSIKNESKPPGTRKHLSFIRKAGKKGKKISLNTKNMRKIAKG